MGRGNGVEVRASSIRLFFVLDGQPQRKTLRAGGKPLPPTPANIKFAERLAVKIRKEIEAGVFCMAEYFPDEEDATVGRGATVSAQLDNWLAGQRIEASTRAGYSSAVKFWQGTIGPRPVRSLKHGEILLALATRPNLSGKTVNNYVSVLREALQQAVLDKLVAANPAAAVPTAKHQKDPPDPFSRPELEAIVADMRERAPASVANLVEAWMWTGMRTSEIAGLRWPNVDLADGHALIGEAMVRGLEKKNTKTNLARQVRLNSMALAAFVAQKQHTFLAGGFVFTDPRYGEPWREERAFRRSFWAPCLKRLGIRYRRPYNMRHTYATQMLMAGMNPAFCAKQLGHSVEMFHRTYARWIDGDRNDAEMARLEATLAPTSPGLIQTWG